MNTQYKVCPRWQQPATLTMQVCQRCGHQYRTQFAPADPTQVIPYHLPPNTTPRKIHKPLLLVVAVALLVVIIGGFALKRILHPYPFIGEWIYMRWAESETSGSYYAFYPNGTGL